MFELRSLQSHVDRLCLCRRQLRIRLLHVGTRHDSRVVLVARQRRRALVRVDRLIKQCKLRIGQPQLEVVARQLRAEAETRVLEIAGGGLRRRGPGSNRLSNTSPEIWFPRDVRTDGVVGNRSARRVDARSGSGMGPVDRRRGSNDRKVFRPLLTDERPCFTESGAGLGQRRIGGNQPSFEVIELRIAKCPPPDATRLLIARLGWLQKTRRSRRLLLVGRWNGHLR